MDKPCLNCDGTGKVCNGEICPCCEGSGRMPMTEEDHDEAFMAERYRAEAAEKDARQWQSAAHAANARAEDERARRIEAERQVAELEARIPSREACESAARTLDTRSRADAPCYHGWDSEGAQRVARRHREVAVYLRSLHGEGRDEEVK